MNLEQIGTKLTEVANDVKWLVKEQTRINGSMTEHVKESDKFRHRVTRNTAWRIAHHFFFSALVGAIGFMYWCTFFKGG